MKTATSSGAAEIPAVIDRTAPDTTATPPWPRAGYAWYVVGVLLLVYTLSFVDRMILALLVEPIKAALGISDTQMGMLIGLAFALFYTLLGLPLAWIADRYNRRNLIIVGVIVWCVMTALCGFAGSFAMLFLTRVGVGVGEAALSPAAFSMLSDYFPREKLARAIAVYSIGVPLGGGIALVMGAFVVKAVLNAPDVTLPFYGPIDAWRLIFVWVAAPGIILTLSLFTVREPLRRGVAPSPAVDQTSGAVQASGLIAHLLTHRIAIIGLFGGMSLISLVMYGIIAWIPSFLTRSYGMDITSAGLAFGVIMALGGAGGLMLGGSIADRRYRNGHSDAHLWVMRLSIFLGGPFLFAMPLMPSASWALAMLAPAFLLMTMHGVGSVALQFLSPNQYRARITALYFFVVNLIGLGLGPMVMAAVNDHVFHDPASLRYAIALVVAGALPLAAIILTFGMRGYRESVAQIAKG